MVGRVVGAASGGRLSEDSHGGHIGRREVPRAGEHRAIHGQGMHESRGKMHKNVGKGQHCFSLEI